MSTGLTYSRPDTPDAGFSLGGPALDVWKGGETLGVIMRSWRNRGRWDMAPVFWFQPARGKANGKKTETIEEQILWVQEAFADHGPAEGSTAESGKGANEQ